MYYMERRFTRILNLQHRQLRRLCYERLLHCFCSPPTFAQRQLLHDLVVRRGQLSRQVRSLVARSLVRCRIQRTLATACTIFVSSRPFFSGNFVANINRMI